MPLPRFWTAEPVKLSEEEREKLLSHIEATYSQGVEARNRWNDQHNAYEQMFRGQMEPRVGPWEGSADLHVQMPYWLVDSVNVRLVASVWNQTPIVSGHAEEMGDDRIVKDAARLVSWHLQPHRMNARAKWNRASKIRLIHGVSVSLMSYASDTFKYRVVEPDVEFVEDEDGNQTVKEIERARVQEGVRYDGPVLTPLEWEDVIAPVGCANLQPSCPSNPHGADQVVVRQWEPLNLIFKSYDLPSDWTDKDAWRDAAPAQDRSEDTGNVTGVNTNDRLDGINRLTARNSTQNPEFCILKWFGPWKDPSGDDDEEMVVIMCQNPKVLLGVYRLSDLYYSCKRPLLEMHYQTVGTRFYSMGIMEIVKHLSAELDTIHNMRVDIGQATNLPFFFYRASSQFQPEEIELKPLKGIPIDNPGDVMFPQMQNVTSFYYQEETLLYTLVERVVGVTDLFLGISPTRGAAARHATGFVGTQQEAMARTSEILTQDSETASDLFHWIYDLEMQYGPDERAFRLLGETGPLSYKLSRNNLWIRGEYDFRLGANQGMYSQMLKQQQAQAVLETIPNNPFISQDPGRLWEAYSRFYFSIGMTEPEIEMLIGPKDAVSKGNPKTQDEENAQMAQYQFGPGVPAPVHPADNDRQHVQEVFGFLNSQEFAALQRPNEQAFMAHVMQHQQAIKQKSAQAQMQQMQQAPQQQMEQQGSNGQQDRMLSQILAQPSTDIRGVSGSKQPQPSVPNMPQVNMR